MSKRKIILNLSLSEDEEEEGKGIPSKVGDKKQGGQSSDLKFALNFQDTQQNVIDKEEKGETAVIVKKQKSQLSFKKRKARKEVDKASYAGSKNIGDPESTLFSPLNVGPEVKGVTAYESNEYDEEVEMGIPVSPKGGDKFSEIANDSIDIIVHRLTPPFLDSDNVLSSSQKDIVDVIRDPTGDLYKYSHNGSHLVNERRKQRQLKSQQKDIKNENPSFQGLQETETNTLPPASNNVSENLEIRKQLPAFKVKSELLNLISENQVVIVIGETGSGKTTQIPQFLYDANYHNRGLIGITQPRRVAAISVAKRVSEEMAAELGKEVGYSVRFNDKTSEETKIKFMTDGILLREALQDNELDQYSCVIMDEAHERSLNTDILLGLFKELLKKRRDLKLIITSATMNYQRFSSFYGNAPVFFIPGKTFPVEILYQSYPSVDYVDSSVKQALRIHLSKETGDILIFMTGQEDIEATCESIKEELMNLQKIDKTIVDLSILPIYSSLSNEEQSKVFNSSKLRKCIVATNIAETSLTFENVKFVVDTGLMKLKVFNPMLNMDTLRISPISQAQANQRSGRAGRTSEGKAFRLYTLTSLEEEMWPNPIPEIQRSNLMQTILILKNIGINEIAKFQFIDSPSIKSLQTSEYELWSIGALDNNGFLTKLGKEMSRYPLEPSLSKLLILSTLKSFSCSREVVRIISMISTPSVYEGKVDDKKAESQRSKFIIEDSDHLTLLNIFNQSENHKNNLEKWCKANYLNFKSLRQAHEIHLQLSRLIQNKQFSCGTNWDIIRECVCAAFMQNSAQFYKQNQYQHLRSGLPMYIHPRACVYGMGDLPKYIVYHELIFTGHKQYLQYITAVDGYWLVKYGGIFFDIRKKGVNNIQHQRSKEIEFKNSLLK